MTIGHLQTSDLNINIDGDVNYGRTVVRREKRLWGILIMLVLLIRCTPFDYKGELPNGYELAKINSTEIAVARGSVVFSGNISRMNIRDNLVFGEINELPLERQKNQTYGYEASPGYFILNTKTGSLQLGLEKEEWLNNLEKLGISGEPTLRSPTAFADEPLSISTIKLVIFLGVLRFLIFSP